MSISFATFYNIPRFFELERYTFLPTNETLVRSTSLRNNHVYVSIYNTWMKMVSIALYKTEYRCIVELETLSQLLRKAFRDEVRLHS